MGWSVYENVSASEVEDYIRRECRFEEIAKARNGVYWIIASGRIVCVLAEYDGRIRELRMKFIDECDGPAYYSCPRKFLNMTAPVNAGWRKNVRTR